MSKLAKALSSVVVVALATVAISACGSGGETATEGGEITIAQSSQPDFLDPALSYTVNGWEPMWLVYTPPSPTATRRARRAPS